MNLDFKETPALYTTEIVSAQVLCTNYSAGSTDAYTNKGRTRDVKRKGNQILQMVIIFDSSLNYLLNDINFFKISRRASIPYYFCIDFSTFINFVFINIVPQNCFKNFYNYVTILVTFNITCKHIYQLCLQT